MRKSLLYEYCTIFTCINYIQTWSKLLVPFCFIQTMKVLKLKALCHLYVHIWFAVKENKQMFYVVDNLGIMTRIILLSNIHMYSLCIC